MTSPPAPASSAPVPPPARLSTGARAAAAALLAGLLAGFALARSLTPSEAGLGTHQQLGLPPCTMRVLTGLPCPACGMTTSFAHFTRGQWGGSLSANSGGFVLALLCLGLIPVLAWAALTGRLAFPPPGRRDGVASRPEWWGVMGLSLVGAVTLIDWAFRLAE
ncbi:DUF2752 domain-containing protein [Alienimonas sp. DA493]|uniref:DUF2752 domain-containing protein n=1 Tax=Alienimonas sp. DA493 TaxID=3373605 RepID=UPI00375404C8